MDYPNIVKNEQTEYEIDLLELLYYYRTKIWYIIGAFLIGAILAGVVTWQFITPKYTATAKMYMVSSSTGSVVDLTDLNIGTSLSQDYVELIQTRPVYENVIQELKLDYEYKDLKKMVSIGTVGQTRILTIAVTSVDPKEAADIANALATEAEKTLPKLMDTPKPNIAEKAIIPEEKSSPSLKKNIAIAALGCVCIVLAILTVLFLMDDTIKSAEDLEREFGIMPLTVIPEADLGALSEIQEKRKRRTIWDRLFARRNKKKNKKR
ncbi:MAG: capsular polysaccharide biosynthesis protein [Eubacterium sp.]|nr:capsular polysaccharide biosynthesis protein [Eubacterium sp.]